MTWKIGWAETTGLGCVDVQQNRPIIGPNSHPVLRSARNEYRQFCPDFVFWMCKGNNYRIVFVDPKVTEHAQAMRKIDGYRKLFEAKPESPRESLHARWKVSVRLLYFHPRGRTKAPKSYQPYWSADPGAIFA